MRIVDDIVDAIDRRVRNVVAAERLDPMRQLLARESLVELGAERLVVLDPGVPLRKARIGGQARRIQRGYQAGPEFLQRGQMDRDQALVLRMQDISLRQTRTIARCRRHAESEIGGKGLNCEVSHRLQHRYLYQTALSGAAALHERP